MTIKKNVVYSFHMSEIKVKEDYSLSKCCNPTLDDVIIGYYSHDNIIKVHQKNCVNIEKIERERLISLEWVNILCTEPEFKVDQDYKSLEELDFKALQHHADYGIDYSLVLAKKLGISKQEGFDLHQRLKDFLLIKRVEPKIVQYRKGIVPNKWIKHRNHTYYDLTEKGCQYLAFYNKRTK